MPAVHETAEPSAPPRRTLFVKPIFTYPLPVPRQQTSWRAWGGIQSEEDANREAAQHPAGTGSPEGRGRFPPRVPAAGQGPGRRATPRPSQDIAKADALLFYSDGDGAGDLMAEVNWVDRLGKDTIFFVRHRSGPLYYWYEGASARFHRQHTDFQATKTILCEDTVVDRMDEVLWRLRALCGLRATVGSRIVVVGLARAVGAGRRTRPWIMSAGSGSWTSSRFPTTALGKLIREAARRIRRRWTWPAAAPRRISSSPKPSWRPSSGLRSPGVLAGADLSAT